ncbi:MAG: excinuclease ABC subunit UvrC [Dehalococcoidia bacterium]|nr:excinuclease ABC subunit UvrC [Dehalococcoidia bacterium]
METHLLEERLKNAPTSPGVYLMKNESGVVLYVGKASNLRNRIRSYFGSPWSMIDKVQRLTARIDDFEFMVTHSEQEALLLENSMIKKHKPKYNVRLKDDKTYPYMKISLQEDFPRVEFTRRIEKDGAKYYGPFASASSLRKTMDALKKLFPYRSCNRVITGKDARPCLDYYIHRCVGPCIGAASTGEYRQVIDQVVKFMEGKDEDVLTELKAKMEDSAEKLEFERSAVLRDQITSIQRVTERQRISMVNKQMDADVIALARRKDIAWAEVFFIRQGKVIGRDNFLLEGTADETDSSVLSSFLKQFYSSASYIPAEILLPVEPEESELISEWLQSKREKNVEVLVPERGDKKQLIEMVAQNAEQGLKEKLIKESADQDSLGKAMDELREQLNLPRLPKRMECYDISNIQGTNSVASMVVFENGQPKKAHYRRFKIKTVEGANDFASMQEVLRRRFARFNKDTIVSSSDTETLDSQKKEAAWKIVPDLVLIDGGKGQLNAALEVFLEMGLKDVPLASLAKQFEELYVPDNTEPIILDRKSPALYMVQRLRDEAHRFAISFHRDRRSTGAYESQMDSIPGIGPRRKRALLRKFGSLEGIREASVTDIAATPGMTTTTAQKLKQML